MSEQIQDARPAFFWASNSIVDLDLPHIGAYGFAVYMLLSRYSGTDTGQCFPSISTLASKLKISKPTVLKALAILVEAKLITITPRERVNHSTTSNLYTLLDPRGGVNHVDGGGKPRLQGGVNHVDPHNKTHIEQDSLKNKNLANAPHGENSTGKTITLQEAIENAEEAALRIKAGIAEARDRRNQEEIPITQSLDEILEKQKAEQIALLSEMALESPKPPVPQPPLSPPPKPERATIPIPFPPVPARMEMTWGDGGHVRHYRCIMATKAVCGTAQLEMRGPGWDGGTGLDRQCAECALLYALAKICYKSPEVALQTGGSIASLRKTLKETNATIEQLSTVWKNWQKDWRYTKNKALPEPHQVRSNWANWSVEEAPPAEPDFNAEPKREWGEF